MTEKRKTVDLIASGYEWICLECEMRNDEIEATEWVACDFCFTIFDTMPPEHAY